MPEIPVETGGESPVETRIGAAVVLLATFLGICSVKSGNIAQQMQQKQADRNNSWAWYQARNLREAVYEATSDELSLARPNESADERKAREAKASDYKRRTEDQARKKEDQKKEAEQAEVEYKALNAKDDQFDICEATLTLALALMGVTALVKKRWLFWFALVPAGIGVIMGVAGFMGMDTDFAAVRWVMGILS